MNFRSAYFRGIVFFFIVLLVVGSFSIFSFGAAVDEGSVDSTYWLTLARYAWNFFEPGNGVVAETGLAGADVGHPYFTDWDLGFYLQAIIDAEKIGLIDKTGVWGADDRINRVLTFLENRPLHPNGTVYVWYSALNFKNQDNLVQVATDTGKLLIALYNLKLYDPGLKNRVDSIVYEKTNYETQRFAVDYVNTSLTSDGIYTVNIYDYYLTVGFTYFWPQRFTNKLNAIANVVFSAPTVNYEGVVLPKIRISNDPLLFSIFEFEKPDARLLDLSRRVYLAHEARYNVTSRFVAFSEGSTGLDWVPVVYEWVVVPDGRMWVLQYVSQESGGEGDPRNYEISISPIIYLKAAVGFLAVYNTPFAQSMVDYLVGLLPFPSRGFNQGVDEAGRVLSHSNMGVSNGAIVTAARYALEHNVSVTSTLPVEPTPTPQQGSSPSGASSPSPSVKPTSSPVPSLDPNGNGGLPFETPVPSLAPSPSVDSIGVPLPSADELLIVVVPGVVVVVSVVVFVRKFRGKRALLTS